jgi:hypothetical protein
MSHLEDQNLVQRVICRVATHNFGQGDNGDPRKGYAQRKVAGEDQKEVSGEDRQRQIHVQAVDNGHRSSQ